MLNGLKPYNYLTYVMEQMKALGPFPEKEAMLKLLPWSTSLPADCHSKLKKKKSVFDTSTPWPPIMGESGVPFCVIFLHNSLMNILQQIFTDHYEEIIYTLHPRDTEVENIDKMINCGDPSFGGAMYGCPHCGKLKFVPFRCHSRFCPSCGNKYAMERTASMSFKLVDVSHRHCVFTI